MTPRTFALVVTVLCCLVSNGAVAAEVKLTVPSSPNYFGIGVALSGPIAVVGAPAGSITDDGAAYLFRYSGSGWDLEQVLLPTVSGAQPSFGKMVSVSGEVVAITDDSVDALWIYRYSEAESSWLLVQPPISVPGLSGPGDPIDIDGEWIVVGTDATGPTGTTGSVQVLRNAVPAGGQWQFDQLLVASDAATGKRFGHAVALGSGAVLFVGAPSDADQGTGSGAVYVFRYNGSDWIEIDKLHPSDPEPGRQFGYSVAADGYRVLIGARDSEVAANAGAVYVFDSNNGTNWSESQKLVPWEQTSGQGFGSSVAVLGKRAVVGAPGRNENQVVTGAGYLFTRNDGTWVPATMFIPANEQNTGFGANSIGLSPTHVLAGAYGQPNAAYVYDLPPISAVVPIATTTGLLVLAATLLGTGFVARTRSDPSVEGASSSR